MRRGIYAIYREERDKGLSYQQIADKYGVTRQNVGIACGKANPNLFQFHPEKRVVFPNLRKWMNDNKISTSELTRRLGLEASSANMSRVRLILRGGGNPRRTTINKLMEVTGMTYDVLFAEGGDA